MNYDQPPPYGGPTASGYPAPPGPLAPGYDPQPNFPSQAYPTQAYPAQLGYPSQGYHAQGYHTANDPTSPPYPQMPPGPYPTQPGYQGYQTAPGPPQPQFGWHDGAQRDMYGNVPKNTVYMVEERRPEGRGVGGIGGMETCLGACWTALCCCCLWDMMT